MKKRAWPRYWKESDTDSQATWRKLRPCALLQCRNQHGGWDDCWLNAESREMDREHIRCTSRGRAIAKGGK